MRPSTQNDKARFKVSGTVGTIFEIPHERYVGDVVVLELHLPSESNRLMTPWYVLFDHHQKVDGIKTGDKITVTGFFDRTSDDVEKRLFNNVGPQLRPMLFYLWGETWQNQSQ